MRVHSSRKHSSSSSFKFPAVNVVDVTAVPQPPVFDEELRFEEIPLADNNKEVVTLYLKYAGEKCIPESTTLEIISDCNRVLQGGMDLSIFRSKAVFVKYLADHDYPFVMPVVHQCAANCPVTYVSICKSLANMLRIPGMVEEIQVANNRICEALLGSQDNDIFDFEHGSNFREVAQHFQDENFVLLLVYTDEYGLANPLGPKSKSQKTFACYVTVANVRRQLRSRVKMYNLVLLCKSENVQEFGLKTVLTPLLEEWKSLEETGVTVNDVTYSVHLLYMPEDNLAAHLIGGFAKSFNGFRPSRFCLVTKPRLRQIVTPNCCSLRT